MARHARSAGRSRPAGSWVANHPNVKAYASTPGSRNSISNVSIRNWRGLSDQLIQPLGADRSDTLIVDVGSMREAGRLSIDKHAETDGAPPVAGPITR